MLRRKNILFSFFFLSILAISCSDDDDNMNANLILDIQGLEDLGSDALYEGWIIVNGSPVTTGTFSVDQDGNLSSTRFEVDASDLENASTFVLTIEPSPDPDPAPSDVHILAGDFGTDDANLTIDHGAALANDFSSVSGNYILATPTDGSNNNENSGVWFLDLTSGSPSAGLTLPTLPAGWIYEGWAVIEGNPVSTGRFLEASQADDLDVYSGDMAGPPFPGEDFLNNAPGDLNFPVDLSEATVVVSIEPVPDNSTAPFLLKPLVAQVPANAQDHFTYDMGANLTFPTGMAKR